MKGDLIESFIVYSWRTFHGLSLGDRFMNGDCLEQSCSLLQRTILSAGYKFVADHLRSQFWYEKIVREKFSMNKQ